MPGRKPTRNFDALSITHLPPGAQKEKVRERAAVPESTSYDHIPHVHEKFGGSKPNDDAPAAAPKPKRSPRIPPRPYAELRVSSAFSFLDGASLPEDLIAAAAEQELPAMALVDRNGVYGAPRFYTAARKAGVRALVGAELVLDEQWRKGTLGTLTSPSSQRTGEERDEKTGDVRAPAASHQPPPAAARLTLLVANRTGYRNLCRLITAGAMGRPKGEAAYSWKMIEQYSDGLHCLTGGDEGAIAHALKNGAAEGERLLDRLGGLFPGRLHVELQRHRRRDEEHRNAFLTDLARRRGLPLIATNGVRYATADDKELHDVLTCIREGQHVDKAGRLLGVNRERHVKPAAGMCALFEDLPEAIDGAWSLAGSLDFTLADLGYQFPDYPLPPGETNDSFLRKITWNAAKSRFRPLTARAQAQLEKELNMIEKLQLAGYFLIVWDIVQFCSREKILVQGRGSAANSAVCYALGITAVDPVKMELLFERFLSEERGEWPDIDLDLPSGDQREKVIQHVYAKYGVHGSAMTANVITYRDRSAAREVGKALGYNAEQVDKLSKAASSWNFGEIRDQMDVLPEEMAKNGFDVEDLRVRHFLRLYLQIQNLPRHLGQHSGGMVMAKGRLDEVVPLEPASMPGRVVIQWDKEDCADLGIIKVDLLGLGMLAAIEEMLPLIRTHEGQDVDLAHLPQDDPKVYRMLNEADTVGMFQVESRAQMASLPRNAPAKFYDIVVQVAIIRPGPIVGGMIRPFFDRRQGKVPVEYPHPCLEPILERTLGVPLFQEQLLRIAMVAANFTGGEAEELRRAMGFKRSMQRMAEIETRLRAGMTKNGIGDAAQEQIVKSITSFALYGFPESHAASFALIAYASAYLKAHHPAAFYVALLNAWPMGFYHPATLVKDAQRRGVAVLPVDVNHSGWMCRWENGAVRLGMRFVKGLREATGRAIEREQERANAAGDAAGVILSRRSPGGAKRGEGPRDLQSSHNERPVPFTTADGLAQRCRIRDDQLTKLAYAGALASLGLTRRASLWQAAKAARPAGELFEETMSGSDREPLRHSDQAALRSLVIPTRRSGGAAKRGRGIPAERSDRRSLDRPPVAALPPAASKKLPAFMRGFVTSRPFSPARSVREKVPKADEGDGPIARPLTRTPLRFVSPSPRWRGARGLDRWPPAFLALSRRARRSRARNDNVAFSPSGGKNVDTSSPLPEMSRFEETAADYAAMEMTAGPHLMEHFRKRLRAENVVAAADLKRLRDGSRVTTAGAVIVRQRPGTAKGFVFLTLEDETGLSQAIVHPDLFRQYRSTILGSSGLVVEGILQNGEGQSSVRAEKLWPLEGVGDMQSHDFH